MLLQTVRSGNSHCLEGTHIATIDGDETILSSGFEDYYLSGQYFDAGPFATPISGSETLPPATTRPAAWRSSWLRSDTLVVWRQ